MKKTLGALSVILCLNSCAVQTPLYTWSDYNLTSYKYLKNVDDASTTTLMTTYENIINQQAGARHAVPPGIYADYGFLLLQQNRTAEGKAMLIKEIELYPESKVFIDRVLEKIDP